MYRMQIAELELALARSGLDDETYTDAVALLRSTAARLAAADQLAEDVDNAQHYLPDTVIAAVGRYRLAAIADARTYAA